jgi:predicted nucleic acid-binding Zn ribbon protein
LNAGSDNAEKKKTNLVSIRGFKLPTASPDDAAAIMRMRTAAQPQLRCECKSHAKRNCNAAAFFRNTTVHYVTNQGKGIKKKQGISNQVQKIGKRKEKKTGNLPVKLTFIFPLCLFIIEIFVL